MVASTFGCTVGVRVPPVTLESGQILQNGDVHVDANTSISPDDALRRRTQTESAGAVSLVADG